MNVQVRAGSQDHAIWLIAHDDHVSPAWVSRCIELDEYRLAFAGSDIVGFLRYSWFWGRIPYMDMIRVVEGVRHQGVGTALFEAWRSEMEARGAKVLMTSSVASELEPQAWHRRNGFIESGRLAFGKVEPGPEIFFVKDI